MKAKQQIYYRVLQAILVLLLVFSSSALKAQNFLNLQQYSITDDITFKMEEDSLKGKLLEEKREGWNVYSLEKDSFWINNQEPDASKYIFNDHRLEMATFSFSGKRTIRKVLEELIAINGESTGGYVQGSDQYSHYWFGENLTIQLLHDKDTQNAMLAVYTNEMIAILMKNLAKNDEDGQIMADADWRRYNKGKFQKELKRLGIPDKP